MLFRGVKVGYIPFVTRFTVSCSVEAQMAASDFGEAGQVLCLAMSIAFVGVPHFLALY